MQTFLEERRLGVEEDLVHTELVLGRDREALRRAESLLIEQPLRESLWEMFILALYRLGRQADALTAYRKCRNSLINELGIDPTPKLRALEGLILNQDARLDLVCEAAARPIQSVEVLEHGTTLRQPIRSEAHVLLEDGSRFTLTNRVTMGRHPECEIVLADPSVSRRHAEIRSINGARVLLDLSSSNGTRIAGEQVMQHVLQDGEVIEIGRHRLVYCEP